MGTGDILLGPFRVIEWPEGPGQYGRAQHQSTLEYFCLRWSTSLEQEVSMLHVLAGGSGINLLHWAQTVQGMGIMITDPSGPTLEELFCQNGRSFSIPTLLLLGCQIISRVQFIHSRGIIHGNLSPFAFACGQKEWQKEQVLLVDYPTKTNASTHDDLYAVGCILLYFYHKVNSWEEYQQDFPSGDMLPVLETFFTLVSSPGPPDYSSLRGAFVDAYHHSITQLGPYWEFGSGLICTQILFDNLNSTLSAIGKSSDTPHTPAVLESILGLFDRMLQIYKTLLFQDRPSQGKRSQVTGAHYLPNRLWRDLRWFIKRFTTEQVSFRYTVLARVYHFLCVLHDMVQPYQIYWTDYLLIMAKEWADMDSGRRQEWNQTALYWRDVQNELKAASSPLRLDSKIRGAI
ncbi:kinase-like domain-containing protein [Aspergillus granulosus]|uniref:Kinase-like domain-containing protein n=1 Tax=Aspergillus granulosus TaxID=176169 RepID=A0ABR4GZL0_9EURO